MRRILLSVALLAVAASPAMAASGQNMKICSAAWSGLSPAVKAKTTHNAYMEDCLKSGPPMASTPVAMAMPVTGSPQQRMKNCADTWNAAKKAGTTHGQTYQQFTAACMKGN